MSRHLGPIQAPRGERFTATIEAGQSGQHRLRLRGAARDDQEVGRLGDEWVEQQQAEEGNRRQAQQPAPAPARQQPPCQQRLVQGHALI